MTARTQLSFSSDGSIVSVADSPLFSGISDADTGEGLKALTTRFYNALHPTDGDTLRTFCAAAVSEEPAENALLLSLRQFYFFRAAFFEKAADGSICATLYTNTAELYAKASPYAHRILPLLAAALSAIPEWHDVLHQEPESVVAETTPFVPLYGSDGFSMADPPVGSISPPYSTGLEKRSAIRPCTAMCRSSFSCRHRMCGTNTPSSCV